jgi:hypothetical protein
MYLLECKKHNTNSKKLAPRAGAPTGDLLLISCMKPLLYPDWKCLYGKNNAE